MLTVANALSHSSMKQGLHSAALEQYTAALAAAMSNGSPLAPPTMVAVLHCNRAAAYQALGHFPEAIADCARARALNTNYIKVSPTPQPLWPLDGFCQIRRKYAGSCAVELRCKA